MKLYDLEPSGNCYKVRLFCALANIPLDLVPVDFMAGEHKSAKFLAMNPLGELPILQDGDLTLSSASRSARRDRSGLRGRGRRP